MSYKYFKVIWKSRDSSESVIRIFRIMDRYNCRYLRVYINKSWINTNWTVYSVKRHVNCLSFEEFGEEELDSVLMLRELIN